MHEDSEVLGANEQIRKSLETDFSEDPDGTRAIQQTFKSFISGADPTSDVHSIAMLKGNDLIQVTNFTMHGRDVHYTVKQINGEIVEISIDNGKMKFASTDTEWMKYSNSSKMALEDGRTERIGTATTERASEDEVEQINQITQYLIDSKLICDITPATFEEYENRYQLAKEALVDNCPTQIVRTFTDLDRPSHEDEQK